jgi:hypothetical protein
MHVFQPSISAIKRTTKGTAFPLVEPYSTSMTKSWSTGMAKNLVKRAGNAEIAAVARDSG